MDLDLAQVRAFVAAAEDLHFGRAASRLFLTPQAVSKRIRRLEGTLGACVAALAHGARIFRVHDVAPARRALDVAFAILNQT